MEGYRAGADFPIAIGLIAYGFAWVTGLVRFSPEPFEWVAPYAGTAPPPSWCS